MQNRPKYPLLSPIESYLFTIPTSILRLLLCRCSLHFALVLPYSDWDIVVCGLLAAWSLPLVWVRFAANLLIGCLIGASVYMLHVRNLPSGELSRKILLFDLSSLVARPLIERYLGCHFMRVPFYPRFVFWQYRLYGTLLSKNLSPGYYS